MFDWEDEFIIESYRVPWLIWVQLLVTILLVVVLVFGFGFFASDLSNNPNCNSASSSSSSFSSNRSQSKNPLQKVGSCSDGSKVERNETIQRETDPSTSKGIVEEDCLEIDESSAKDIALFRLFGRADHPCKYLGFATQAFLKCLGLGYSCESSRKNKHGKRD
ncbi:hypothetical protein M9H77_19841 [Catharanthus roseus]|uniref:Uncharacterized protein n=1 Tax=Catharanthus roseus TaxID=4058 RepID=A0ACC0BBJ5_CATRO|nr:hypothetical protein M9H77_19841 [Catharanthus roseus]